MKYIFYFRRALWEIAHRSSSTCKTTSQKTYRAVIASVNRAVEPAEASGLFVIYLRHRNLSAGTRTFKPDTRGAAFMPELKVISAHIFTKSKSSALTSEAFAAFLRAQDITEVFLCGTDAAACIKSTSCNMAKAGYTVHVLSDCVTSCDTETLDALFACCAAKGCIVETLAQGLDSHDIIEKL